MTEASAPVWAAPQRTRSNSLALAAVAVLVGIAGAMEGSPLPLAVPFFLAFLVGAAQQALP